MADLNAKIIPLHSEAVSREPDPANLDVGELAYNIPDKKIFTKDSSGNLVVLSSPTALNGLPGGEFINGYDPLVVSLPDSAMYRTTVSCFDGLPSTNNNLLSYDMAQGPAEAAELLKLVSGDTFYAKGRSADYTTFHQYVVTDAAVFTDPGNTPVNGSNECLTARPADDQRLLIEAYRTSDGVSPNYSYPLSGLHSAGIDIIAQIPRALSAGDILRYDGTNWRSMEVEAIFGGTYGSQTSLPPTP